jgi:Mg-chelatase subunit ChlD/molybdopterin biosynthesis enzyme MoaB
MARQRSASSSGKQTTRTPGRARTTKAPARTREGTPGGGSPQTLPAGMRTETRSRFTLYNLLGKERAFYLVDRVELEKPSKPPREKSVAHSIIIIDRSGSMYGYLEDLKDTLLKLLTLDEYGQYDLLVTLISYSSQGDCQVHFQRRPIQEIMKRDSRELKEIKKIHVTGLTCISQAVELASSLARDEELTAITLHSDGYANHPSANVEAKTLEKLCDEMKHRPVFVNTIAYTDYSDFRLLSKVANSVSGSCLKAGNIKQVYDSLYATEKLLGSSVTPPLEVPLEKGYDYQVFVSHKGGRVNGAAGTLQVRGLKEDDDAVVYKFKKLTETEYHKLKDVPEVQTSEAVLAFARTQLSEGAINTAKYALASTYDATLVERHGKALTNLQVAAMAQDLDTVMFQPGILQEHEVLDHVPVNTRISVLELAHLLGQHRSDFTLNLEHLKSNYVRRGLRRVQGTRDDSGKLIEPTLKTEFTDKGDYAPVSSFDINRNTANLNMLIARSVQLVPRTGGKPIKEVAGIKLDKLSTFNNYTMIGDGELNVPTLKIRISSRELFDTLKKEGVLEVDGQPAAKYDARTDYTLRLDTLPLVPPFEGAVPLDGVFEDLAEIKVLSSILAAQLKEEAELYTPEQVEELKKHYLSKNLYINFPTTYEYTDLQQALAEGSVDTRVSYKIDVGNHHIINMGKLMSANKFLDRLYEVIDRDGQKIDKPTFENFLDGDVTVRHKQLSARTKITAVDEMMRRIFDDFFGLTSNGSVSGILKRVGVADLMKVLQEKHKGKKVSRADYVAALTDARRKLDAYSDNLFQEKVSPLVFYVGSTGVLPDEMDTKALTAEQLTAKYPDLALSKDEQEGMFFEIGDTILSVYAKNEYFSR